MTILIKTELKSKQQFLTYSHIRLILRIASDYEANNINSKIIFQIFYFVDHYF